MLNLAVAKIKNYPGTKIDVEIIGVADPAAYEYSDFALAGDVTFRGTAANEGGRIMVEGVLNGVYALNCSRCGKALTEEFETEFFAQYALQAQPDEDGEADILEFCGDNIDLEPQFLQTIFLELPMKPLCSDDCKGLCPFCGKNLNKGTCNCEAPIDPRLAKLKDYVFKDDKKGDN